MSLSTVNIRPVYADDVEELVQLSAATFHAAFAHLNNPDDIELYMNRTFSTDNLLNEINQANNRFYFAEIDNAIVGYIKLRYLTTSDNLSNSKDLEIERLYILASHQGKSIGEQLIIFAVAEAQKLNFDSVILGVWEHNFNAIRFYQRHGFVRYSEHDFMLGTDRQTDWLMRKTL